MPLNNELLILSRKVRTRVDRDGYYKVSLGPELRLLRSLDQEDLEHFAKVIHCQVVRRMGGSLFEFTHHADYPSPLVA